MFQPARERLFFALRPPIRLARQIANAARWFDGGGAVAAERLHVTMFILDDLLAMPAGLVERLCAMGEGLRAAPVTVTLDQVVGGARSIALRPRLANRGLAALHAALADGAAAGGIGARAGYRFSPHMTLGYRDGAPFVETVAPVTWQADELVLIRSHLGRTRHEVVGRWRLDGQAAQLALL